MEESWEEERIEIKGKRMKEEMKWEQKDVKVRRNPSEGPREGSKDEEDGESERHAGKEWRKKAEQSDTCIRECVIKFNLQPS